MATFDRLKKATKMKVMLKGLDSPEDAQLAVQHGVDGIIVSNHGGRSIETLRGTIDCLPDVTAAVAGRVPVFLDGGVRHGADIYKALASGARGVGMGRPYIWGLSAFGEEGVERVLEILRAELRMTMQQMGTPTIKDITRLAWRGCRALVFSNHDAIHRHQFTALSSASPAIWSGRDRRP